MTTHSSINQVAGGVEGLCRACQGNDGDMPCAYPSEGMAGCLRDKRLVPTAVYCPRDLIEQLMHNAFAPGRNPRSDEYKDGVRAVLRQRLVGKPLACPHKAGTASFDAFFAGVDEGRWIWAWHTQALRAAA